MGDQNPWNQQNSAVDAFLNNHNAFQAQNASLNYGRPEFSGNLSANAPEFIPKTIPPQMHMNDWHHQPPQAYPFQSAGHFVNPQRPPIQNHIQSHPQLHHQHQFRNHINQAPHMQPQQQQQQFMIMNNQRPDLMQQQQQQHSSDGSRPSVQNRLQQLHNNQPAPENDGVHAQTETEQVALDFLTEVVSKLNDNPGMFENFQKKLKEMFVELSANHFVLSNAIEIIFEQSIEEQNFRYTGARLCAIFDSLDLNPSSSFRSLLSMKMDYQQSELVKFMQNEQRRVRGTTLFLAELFVQFKQREQSNNLDISRYVLNSILLLLSKPGPENVKCVCQTLKLSGYELQQENPTDVEEAITQLKFISEEQNVQTKRLIQSVVDLFYDNWGRKDEVQESQTPIMPDNVQQNFSDGPVFYGPDGEIITEEENSFLISNINPYPININEIIDENYDLEEDDDDEEEMDLEIRMAFEEFSKNQK